jgi:His/Glu/Gln/Arg/opine family amino acid ABC transporter permease subunit
MTFLSYLPQLLNGLLTTLELMICALLLGACLAVGLTFAALSKRTILRAPVEAFIFFIRGTPLLVQIFLIYFGLGQFDWIRHSPLWILLREPFVCAVLAFAFNTAAYTTVLFKGAIQSVPEGEVVACQALGMSRLLMLRRIIFPRALRIALPTYSNEVVMILKGTSLASTITILDLMGATHKIIAQTYQTLPLLALAGVIYLLVNAIIISIFKAIEQRAQRYLVRE